MTSPTLVGGVPILSSGLACSYSTVAGRTLEYDAVNAVTYAADASGYGLTPATRVDRVPSSGTLPLPNHRDEGWYGAISAFLNGGNAHALPGPLFIPSSARFNGRPCWHTDIIQSVTPTFHIQSMLSPHHTQRDVLSWPQPYSFAIVMCFANGQISGNNAVAWDGDPPMPTINPDPLITDAWSVAAFNTINSVGGRLTSTIHANTTGTFGLCGVVNTTTSSFTVATKNGAGVLSSNTQTGTLSDAGNKLTVMHFGWFHSCMVTWAKMWVGTVDTAEMLATMTPMIGPDGA